MKFHSLYKVRPIKTLIFTTFLFSSLFVLSGCSVIKNITAYNMSDESSDDSTSSNELLSLPESTYIKNTLELSMSNPKSLNPLDASDYSIDQLLKLLYSPLLSVLPDNSLHNELIDSIDEISPTSARIVLKDSITFHNELSLDTKDILFSYNYIKERPESTYYFVTQNIASITVIDAYTFDVVFNRPDKYNYFNLTFPIISKEYVTSKEYSPLHPIGSGPYQLVRFQSMIEMELTQNLAYHDQKGAIPNITASITRKSIDGYNMFTAKRIDVYSTLQTNWHEYSNDKNLQINTFNSPFFYYLGVNHKNTLLKEPDGRKLITSNLPFSKIKKEAFLGHIKFTTLPILPELQEQQKLDPYFSINDTDSFFMREYDPSKTTIYLNNLRKKGYPIIDQVPVTFNLIYNMDEIYQTLIAHEISLSNNRYPVIIKCIGLNTQDYYDAMNSQSYDLFIGTVKVAFIPNLQSLYGTNGLENKSGYSNTNLDGLLASFKTVQTEASLIKQLENLSKVLSEELPIIPFGFLENGYFSHEQITHISKTHYYNLYQNIVHMKITVRK